MSSAPISSVSPVNEPSRASSSRFRFKRKREDSHEIPQGDRDRHHHHHRHRHHRHRSKKRTRSPQIEDDPSNDKSASALPPDTAFRESLFDALGDDEGAAFWQGVYGQPIHTYPNSFRNEETGELERLDDEQYATYVRRKMWEKSWEGIEAAKEQRRQQDREERNKRTEKARDSGTPKGNSHDFLFDLEIDNSLKRGERRKDKRKWKALWQDYVQRWSDLQSLAEKRTQEPPQSLLRNTIPWPVESGKRHDIDAERVEAFFEKCADAIGPDLDGQNTLANLLKTERIRFHPDKIQQRFGFLEIEAEVMQSVTAVFQVVDRMWNKLRRPSA